MKTKFKEKLVLNSIIDDLKKFEHKELHQCPYCNEAFEWNDVDYNPEEQTYTCPICKQTFDENELQNVNFIDYIQETYLAYLRSKENEQY
jgi:transcription elongation factor Elf1